MNHGRDCGCPNCEEHGGERNYDQMNTKPDNAPCGVCHGDASSSLGDCIHCNGTGLAAPTPPTEWTEERSRATLEYCEKVPTALDAWVEPTADSIYFYGKARTDLPAAVREIKRLQALITRIKEALPADLVLIIAMNMKLLTAPDEQVQALIKYRDSIEGVKL